MEETPKTSIGSPVISYDEGSCYVFLSQNTYCEFLASDSLNLQSVHHSWKMYKFIQAEKIYMETNYIMYFIGNLSDLFLMLWYYEFLQYFLENI